MKTVVLTLLVATVSKVLADEAKDLMIWLPAKLIRWASRQFLLESRARIEEEWLAHCNDLPGNLARLLHALGCVWVAFKLTDALARTSLTILIVPFVELTAPFSIALALLMGLPAQVRHFRPESVRARRIRRATAGFVVLGLNKLELIPSDYRLEEKIDALAEMVFAHTLAGRVFDFSMQRALRRYLRLWPRLRRTIGFVAED